MGVAGLGRAFTLMLPTLTADPRVELVAGADPRPEATRRFAGEFGARVYASVEALCADDDVDVVYVATPHHLHAEPIAVAAARGQHLLGDKPRARGLDHCRSVVRRTRSGRARRRGAWRDAGRSGVRRGSVRWAVAATRATVRLARQSQRDGGQDAAADEPRQVVRDERQRRTARSDEHG